MKKLKKVISIIICVMFLFTITSNLIYALNENVLPGYNQVTNVGGENNKNTLGQQDGVTVSKTIEETDIENYFDITLKVNTTNNISEILKDQDLAIVIVMDISNTMIENKVGNVTRYEAAMEAGSDFINQFATYSNGVTATRKIGYVSFNTNSQQIFALEDCKTATKAKTLIETMKTKTGEIINKSGYNASHNRFTNIESGLKRAKNMLNGTSVKNKYIILLSDGFPTTYISSNYSGYDPYMSEKDTMPKQSSEGNFYNEIHGLPCKHGTDYSDRAAIKAREMATSIKNSGIKIFSVGTGLDQQKTISYYMEQDKGRKSNTGDKKFATVDTETTNYEIGNTIASYKDWLKNSIGSGFYYDTTSTEELKNAYKTIFDQVKKMSQESAEAVWVVEDPMGTDSTLKNIEFLGLYDDLNNKNNLHDSLNSTLENQSDTANFSNNKISWDLKNSSYQTKTEGNTTYYIYEIKYRIRLKNELNSFEIDTIYNTNEKTTLTYVIRTDAILSENKYIDFPIPKVVGYLGNLIFTKKSSFDNTNLDGVKFELTHDSNCKCHQERKYATIEKMEAISNEQGTVTFVNIPSGHTYKLIETNTHKDYILSDKIYDIVVSYGETSGIPQTNIITNDIKKSNLEIQKIVEGNVNNPGTFKFNLEVYFKEDKLTGNYNYKINNGETKVINIGTDTIELGNNDSIIIYDLPVGATYKIVETTTEGYEVQYKLNTSDRQNGNIVTCSKENGCRIEEGDINKVKFINIGGYLLPETGSSGMLILLIIGSLLLIGPIIYIGYEIYKNKKKIA